jgi:hypothetical protein
VGAEELARRRVPDDEVLVPVAIEIRCGDARAGAVPERRRGEQGEAPRAVVDEHAVEPQGRLRHRAGDPVCRADDVAIAVGVDVDQYDRPRHLRDHGECVVACGEHAVAATEPHAAAAFVADEHDVGRAVAVDVTDGPRRRVRSGAGQHAVDFEQRGRLARRDGSGRGGRNENG